MNSYLSTILKSTCSGMLNYKYEHPETLLWEELLKLYFDVRVSHPLDKKPKVYYNLQDEIDYRARKINNKDITGPSICVRLGNVLWCLLDNLGIDKVDYIKDWGLKDSIFEDKNGKRYSLNELKNIMHNYIDMNISHLVFASSNINYNYKLK